MGEEVRVTIPLSKLLRAASILLIVIVGAYVIAYDYSTDYLWVLPLDSAKTVFGYPKAFVRARAYDVWGNASVSSLDLSGFPLELVLGPSEGKFAVIYARGPNAYVILIVTISYIVGALFLRKLGRGVRGPALIGAVMFIALVIASQLSLIPYINYGKAIGYSYYEPYGGSVSIPFSALNYEVRNISNVPYYYYAIYEKDKLRGYPVLVSYKIELNDNAIPIVVYGAISEAGNYSGFAYEKSLYLYGDSAIGIEVYSTKKLENTTLKFYAVSFSPGASGAELLYMLTSVSALAASIGIGALLTLPGNIKRKVTWES